MSIPSDMRDPRDLDEECARLTSPILQLHLYVNDNALYPVPCAHVSQAVALIRAAQAALELAQYAQAAALAEGRR